MLCTDRREMQVDCEISFGDVRLILLAVNHFANYANVLGRSYYISHTFTLFKRQQIITYFRTVYAKNKITQAKRSKKQRPGVRRIPVR